jgi:hypothetical protein
MQRPKPLPKRTPKGMNGTERKYAEILELRKKAGEILDAKYEGITLKLADGSRYTPDFFVTFPGHIECHETKGGLFREAARVRLLVAAEQFWQFRFVLVRYVNKQWSFEEI